MNVISNVEEEEIDALDFVRRMEFVAKIAVHNTDRPEYTPQEIMDMFPMLDDFADCHVMQWKGKDYLVLSSITYLRGLFKYLGCDAVHIFKDDDKFTVMCFDYLDSISPAGTEVSIKNKSFEVYVQGCYRECHGCHNPETQVFDDDRNHTVEPKQFAERMKDRVATMDSGLIENIYISGGDLLCQNTVGAEVFSYEMRKAFPDKILWLFTGEVESNIPKWVWNYFDVVKCGPFIDTMIQKTKDGKVMFPASRNQKLLLNMKSKLYDSTMRLISDETISKFQGEVKWTNLKEKNIWN